MKKDEKKLQNEREWHGGWDDVELEKRKDNLGIEDGADLECIKMIILFILNVYYHIFLGLKNAITLRWEAQSTTFPLHF